MSEISVIDKKIEAEVLHERIVRYGTTAASSLFEMCRCLKQMHDEKLYVELGFNEFADYTKERLGIAQRQAYHYISVLNKFGEKGLQENAALGITKLELLSAAPEIERKEIMENNDIAGMTAAEVKALVDKCKQQGEQLELLQQKNESISAELEDANISLGTAETKLEESKAEIDRLNSEIEQNNKKPTEVAVAEPSKEELESLYDKAKTEVEDELNKKHEKELNKAVKDAKAEAKREVADQLKMLEAEKAASVEKALKLEKELQVSADPEMTRFSFLFEQLQETQNRVFESIGKLKPETKEKATAVIRGYLTAALEIAEGIK